MMIQQPEMRLLFLLFSLSLLEIGCQSDLDAPLRPESSFFLRHKVILDGVESSSSDHFEDKCDKCPQLCSSDKKGCSCFRGFAKISEFHCQDVDECASNKDLCGPHGRCINTLGSFVCRCQFGFQPLPSGKCSDINECSLALNKRPCDQICTNLPGSYECSCQKGYELLAGSGKCQDVNECVQEENVCSHLCVNTPGSFVCRCPSPLTLSDDERTCSSAVKRQRKSPALLSKTPLRNEQEDIHRCPHKCLNGGVCKDGSCQCPSGVSGRVCQTDIDECSVLPDDMKCSHFCINTFGSFRCGCRAGFALAVDARTCVLISCTPPCMGGGTCHNGVCKCPPGLTGRACETDIDECQLSNPCQHICHNTLASFVCLCRGKWRLGSDGKSCVEPTCVPHCRNGGVCHQGRCICQPGFHGRICQLDVNECALAEQPCPYACLNTIGSYQCLCPAGFKQSPNRTACLVNSQADEDNLFSNLEVVIEVVVQDDTHSSFTRYYVTPVLPSKQKTASFVHKSVFPYQPLFENHKEILHFDHSKNAIPKLNIDSHSHTIPTIFKTEDHIKVLEDNFYNSVISPSITESSILPLKSLPASQPDVHFVKELEPTNSSTATPVLPLERNLIIASTLIELTRVQEISSSKSFPISVTGTSEENSLIKNIIAEISTENNSETNLTTPEKSLEEITEQDRTDNSEASEFTTLSILEETLPVIEWTTEETKIESVTETDHAFEEVTSPIDFNEFTTETSIGKDTTKTFLTHTSLEITTVASKHKKMKQKAKGNLKKKKGKNKKGSKISAINNNHRVLSQILDSFGIENHQGDAKHFDLIDFDKISVKQAQELTTPKSFDLPVLKFAPSNTSERDCYYGRNKFKSRSHFFRDEKNCTRCFCKNGELRCDPRHCPEPGRCNKPIKGNCCDYCPSDCVIDNQVYQPGEAFVPELDPCRECRCENGRTTCTDLLCPALPCPAKHRAQLPDDCCPSCVPPGPGCFWNQQFFYTGQLWVQRQGGCQACLCREEGVVQCNPVPCIVDCSHPQFVTGECCPICDGCQYQNKKFSNGNTFRHLSDNCSLCTCMSGNISCFEERCQARCGHPYKPPGKCCPECSDCFFEREHIKEGSSKIFGKENGTCTECSCKAGEIHCRAAECSLSCVISNGTVVPSGEHFTKPNDHCTKCKCHEGQIGQCETQACVDQCEFGVLLPGACCVQCNMCDYKGKIYVNGQSFKEPSDLCLDCTCNNGNVLCFDNCPEGSGNTQDDEVDEDYDDDSEEE
ncbi:uncharacterized protein LOC132200645 [Neocloeon triangulifer]|uniref:uncharacterized protein LOC132200645 n=1 Tax=Neocloeon triangulifer TaxID=2078957 RepID=UPI00286F7D08|nr:uncharacterized protein LOC132200645 [Neocloeon triangulifer]